ncbi:MAG: sterol desaturase family protein [Deltaproteobacteria bacterium]|nr:sterol desaturase family protein [Deltaproteobacteria bacterium]
MIGLGLVFGSLIAVSLWELCCPRRRRGFPALGRRLSNLGFWIVNLVLAAYLLPKVALSGIRLQVPLRPEFLPERAAAALSLLAGFLILDLLQYVVHRCEHRIPFLWRFHALHHTDPDVDVTTSVRHHPFEYLPAAAIYSGAGFLLAIPANVITIHALAVFVTAAVQHGNIRLPHWCERGLSSVLVTTDLHRVHHSAKRAEADANYGAVLSVWDRVFGTLVLLSPREHQRIVFGVADMPRHDGLNPIPMLLLPLQLGRRPTRRVPAWPPRMNSRRNSQRRNGGKATVRPKRV